MSKKTGDKNMSKEIIKPEKPAGFIDYLTKDYLTKERIIAKGQEIFRSHGYDPVETPRVEFLKTLSSEQSDTGKQIFTIEDSSQEGQLLALPFDHTVPFARLIASYPYNSKDRTGIVLPWRRVAYGPVFRGERPQAGRYRQFYQLDVDIVGSSSMIADAEIVKMIYLSLSSLGLDNFLINLSNRKILNGLAFIVGIKDRGKVSREDIIKQMFRILEKVEKIGKEGVMEELSKKPENELSDSPALSQEALEKVGSFMELKGSNRVLVKECKKMFRGVKDAEDGARELEKILDCLETMDVPEEYVKVDFSIARGLDYYDGPVMEATLTDLPEIGSIFSGGRYNDLVKRFTGKTLPAVGASMGVDRVLLAMKKKNLMKIDKTTVAEALVLRLDFKFDREYMGIAEEIRGTGLNCEISLLDDTTFQGQFNYALKKGVKYVVIAGEEELKRGEIQVKNLQTRKQESLKKGEIKKYFSSL
jgi:histidyl-tRNA synthetase